MIRIVYDPARLQVTVRGHAPQKDGGISPVCAAVSMLVYTLAAEVAEWAAEARLTQTRWLLRSGDACVACTPQPAVAHRVRAGFETLCRGFELLCTQFPDQVTYERS